MGALVNPVGVDASNAIIDKNASRFTTGLRFETYIPFVDTTVPVEDEGASTEYMRPKVFLRFIPEDSEEWGWFGLGTTTTPGVHAKALPGRRSAMRRQ